MNFSNKKAAIIYSVVLICLVLFANCLIVVGHGHDCIGENCNVCSALDAAERILGGFVLLAIIYLLIAKALLRLVRHALTVLKKYFHSTPISLKVKLTD